MATALSLLAYTIALAASGDLDTTFSSDGLYTTHFSHLPGDPDLHESAYATVVQPDGKFLLAGGVYDPADPDDATTADFALARYEWNDPLWIMDYDFSYDGLLETDFGARETAYDVAIQGPDDRIVAVGNRCGDSGCDAAVARYFSWGALDSSFGGIDGKQVILYGPGLDNTAQAVVIQPDGMILIAGYRDTGSGFDMVLYRLDYDGFLDPSFSGDGRASIDFGADEYAMDLALQADGKIVVAGSKLEAGLHDFALARLNPDGSLDTTFSGDGKHTSNFGANDFAASMAIQSDGRIVVSGSTCDPDLFFGEGCDVAVARYTTGGALDTGFSGNGKVVIGHGTGLDNGSLGGLLISPDGRIVIAGYRNDGNDQDFALYRLNSDGTLDDTFSGNGAVRFDFGYDDLDIATDLAVQLDGKYILVGYSAVPSELYDFAVARVLP